MQRFLNTVHPELDDSPRTLLGTPDGIERVLELVERDVRDSLDPGFRGALAPRDASMQATADG